MGRDLGYKPFTSLLWRISTFTEFISLLLACDGSGTLPPCEIIFLERHRSMKISISNGYNTKDFICMNKIIFIFIQ